MERWKDGKMERPGRKREKEKEMEKGEKREKERTEEMET
jgi:hypothetical protein